MKAMDLLLIIVSLAVGCAGPSGANSLDRAVASDQDLHDTLGPEEQGIRRAKEDIANGEMKILYFGKPWPEGKPLIDDESGLRVELTKGCCVTPDFVREATAYNDIMRLEAVKRKGGRE